MLLVGVHGAEGAALQSVLQRQGAAVLSCHWKAPQLQSEVSTLLSAWAHPASPLSACPCQLSTWQSSPLLPFPRGRFLIAVTGGTGVAGSWCGLGSFLLPASSEMVQTLASTRILHVTAAALTSLFYTRNCERRNPTKKYFSSPFCFLSAQEKCPLFFSSCDTVICMKLLPLDLCPKGLRVLLLLGQEFPIFIFQENCKRIQRNSGALN